MAASLVTKRMEMVPQPFIRHAGEVNLVTDMGGMTGHLFDLGDRRPKAPRIVFRKRNRHVEFARHARQDADLVHYGLAACDTGQDFFLHIDDHKLGIARFVEHCGLPVSQPCLAVILNGQFCSF